MWGIDVEVTRWYELHKMHPFKTKLEISEMVLEEDIPSRLGEAHRSKFM